MADMEDFEGLPPPLIQRCGCTEIPDFEIERMRTGKPPDQRYAKFLAQREHLKKLSDERANKWPNTIKALRIKREQAFQQRLEREEEERKKLDKEEAKIRAKKRLEVIERAGKLLQHSQFFNYRSRKLLDEVNVERNAQIQYNNALKEMWKKRETIYHKYILEKGEQEKREDEEWRRQEYKKAVAIRDFRTAQLEENHQIWLKDEAERNAEKKRIQRQAELDVIEEEEKEKRRIQRIKEIDEEAAAANLELKVRREAEKLKILEEEKKIAEYVKWKQNFDDEVKRKANAIKAEKQGFKDRLIARQAKQLEEARKAAADRLRVDETEREIKEEAIVKFLKDKRAREYALCDKSRQMQLEQKRIAEKRELQEKEATLAQAWERAWEAKRADEEEWKARHDTNVAFAQTYKKHVAEQQRAMAHEKKELYQADKEMVEMMKRDDAQYVMGPDGTMTMRDLQL